MSKRTSAFIRSAVISGLILGVGLLFGYDGVLSAPEVREGPDAIAVREVRVLEGGSADYYPGWLADNDPNTYWRIDGKAVRGIVELTFADAVLLYGIHIVADVEEKDALSFSYLRDGQWIPMPVAVKRGGTIGPESLIPVSALRIVATAVRCRLDATLDGGTKIHELGFTGIAADKVFHKLSPENVYTKNLTAVFSPVSNLTDNNTSSVWHAGERSAWGHSEDWSRLYSDGNGRIRIGAERTTDAKGIDFSSMESEIEKCLAAPGRRSTFAINYQAGSQLKEIRFFPEADSLDAVRIDARHGLKTMPVFQSPGGLRNGWNVITGRSLDDFNSIMVELTGKRGQTAGMAEFECWGYGNYGGRCYAALSDGAVRPFTQAISYVFQNQFSGDGEMYILFEGAENRNLRVNLNGMEFVLNPQATRDGNTSYTVKVKNPIISDQDQSISVYPFEPSAGTAEAILAGVWFRDDLNTGEQEETSVSAVESAFAERLLMHDVETWRTPGGFVTVAGRNGGAWLPLTEYDGGNDFTRWGVPDSFLGELDGLRISASDGGVYQGSRILGSVISDHAPRVKIIHPLTGSEIDEKDSACFPFVIATVDNGGSNVTFNGKQPVKIGDYYSLPLAALGLFKEGSLAVKVEAVDPAGRRGEDRVVLCLKDYLFTVNLPEGITRTDKAAITVKGMTRTPFVTMRVNGQPVPVAGKKFSVSVSLTPGINNLTFHGRDEKSGRERTAVRRVLCVDSLLTLTIDDPVNGQYLADASVKVSGGVTGGESVRVWINGTPAVITGSRYLSVPVKLREGPNTVTAFARDGSGQKIEKRITVYRDTLKPVITAVSPAANAIIASPTVAVSVTVKDASPCWVFVNGVKAAPTGNIYEASVPLGDGVRTLTVTAEDGAGNRTGSGRSIIVDTTPPLSFTLNVTPAGWTSNTRPVATFATTDETSGLDRFVMKIDDGSYATVTSPCTLPALSDGAHNIVVKAIDKAGWEQTAAAQAFIDTTPPPAPLSLNLVPGTGRIILNYSPPADDTAGYILERGPAWEAGPKAIAETTLVDSGLLNGTNYSYRVRAVDQAGNQSAFTEWKSAACGHEVEPYSPDTTNIAEYDGASLYVPPQGLPDGSAAISIYEVQAPDLASRAAFPIVSSIYDFSAVDAAGNLVNPGEALPRSYVGALRYDPVLIPAGLTDEDLEVYYFDPLWSRWRACDSVVDKDSRQVYFTATHFSMYEVQATAATDLTADEISKNAYSPFRTYMEHGSLDVSPDNGGLTNRVTELVLPGPNGFDLALSRIYSTAYAKNDALRVTEEALLPYLSQKAEFAFSLAKGVKLDFPYIKNSSRNEYLILPGGAGYSFYEMKLKSQKKITVGEGRESYSRYTLVLIPPGSEDFTLTVVKELDRKITVLRSDMGSTEDLMICDATSYKLHMNNGMEYEFDTDGRLVKYQDHNGLNTVEFSYAANGTQLGYIQDAIGRKIRFEYEIIHTLGYIKRIWIENDSPYNREIIYTHDANGYLVNAKDAGERIWSYAYESHQVPGEQTVIPYDFAAAAAGLNLDPLEKLIKKYENTPTKYHAIPLLKTLRGPGKGIIEAEYGQFAESMTGFTVAKRVNIYSSESNYSDNLPQRITTYEYTAQAFPIPPKSGVSIPAEKRGYIASTTARDGDRESAYAFEAYAKKNAHWVIAGYPASINTGKDEIKETMDDSLYTVCARRTGIERRDYSEGTEFEREEFAYPAAGATERPDKRSIIRGPDSMTVAWTFDKYGNPVSEDTVMLSGDRINRKSVKRTFIDDPQPAGLDPNFKAYNQTNFTVPVLTRVKHGIPLREMTINYVPEFQDGTLVSGEGTPAYQYAYYGYNALGQMTGVAVWDSSRNEWLISTKAYDNEPQPALAGPFGNAVKETGPDGQVVEYTHDDHGFLSSKTVKAVKDADGKTRDITETYGFETATGWMTWLKNPRGFVTENAYDKLGRITLTVYPADADGADYQGGSFTRAGNPRKEIRYFDIPGDYHVEIIDPAGAKAVYSFDDFGQLAKVSNLNRADNTSSDTLVTYNRWGEPASLTNPNGNTTYYEYDAMGRKIREIFPDDSPGNADNPVKRYEYDPATNEKTSHDELNRRTVERHDMAGRVVESTVFHEGQPVRVTAYYDGLGNQVAAFGPKPGKAVYSAYNSLNKLEEQILPEGEFLENGVLATLNPKQEFSYDKMGRQTMISMEGPQGAVRSTVKILNGLGQEIEIQQRVTGNGIDKLLSTAKKYYDLNGNLEREIDPNNAMKPEAERTFNGYTYTARDKALSTTDPAGNVTAYAYNSDDTLASLTGPAGNTGRYPQADYTIFYAYDDLKRLTQAELPPKTAGGPRPRVAFTYDKRGNLLKRTNPDGGVISYAYTARNLAETETATDPSTGKSNTTRYAYDRTGALETTTDPRQSVTRRVYDDLNRLTTVILPDLSATGYEYDDDNNRTAVIDGRGNRTETVYNLYGKPVRMKTAEAGDWFRMQYDRFANKTRTTDPLGRERTWSYDELNRLVEEKDEEDGLFTYDYDPAGNLLTGTDPNGTVATYEYTPLYQITKLTLTNASSMKTKTVDYSYDENGFVTRVNDDGTVSTYNDYDPGNPAAYRPDPYGRVLKEMTAVGAKTLTAGYSYDVMDRLTGIAYPNGRSVSYAYNRLGEVTLMPGYLQGEPVYDHGLAKEYTAGNGIRTEFDYDAVGRMKTLAVSSGASAIKSYAFTYDNAGNIVQKNMDVFTYDKENRLTEADLKGSFSAKAEDEDQTIGAVEDDVLGARQIIFPLEEAVEDPTILSLDYGAGSIGVDLGGEYEVTRIELAPESPVNRVQPDQVRVFTSLTNAPNSYEEKKDFSARYAEKDGKKVLEIGFTGKITTRYVKVKTDYNERALETFIPENRAEFRNAPDKLIRVYYNVGQRNEKYSYDWTGNRTEETITLNNVDARASRYYPRTGRLMTNGRWAYAYDANGNVVGKGDTISINGTATKVKNVPASFWATQPKSTQGIDFTATNGGTSWAYEYDLMNRMVKATKNGTTVALYTYNWKGYRVKKERPNAQDNDVRTIWYTFSPNGKLLYEEEETVVPGERNFFRQYDYLFNKMFAQDVGFIYSDGTITGAVRYYLHTDHLGSVVAATREDGSTAWGNEFMPFGSAADSTNKPEGGYKFASYDFDEDVGLNYARARWQDPETGRFTSLDPVRSGMNWYVYCSSNPLNLIDALGLREITIYNNNNYVVGKIDTADFNFSGNMGLENSFATAISYLANNSTTAFDIIMTLADISGDRKNDGKEIKIENSSNDRNAHYDTKGKIGWAPKMGPVVKNPVNSKEINPYFSIFRGNRYTQMPAMVLAHEMAHAYLYETNAEYKAKTDLHSKTVEDFNKKEAEMKSEKTPDRKEQLFSELMALGKEEKALRSALEAECLVLETKIANEINEKTEGKANIAVRPTYTDTEKGLIATQGETSGVPAAPKIICVELYHQGLMEKEVYEADEEFGRLLMKGYPEVLLGYQFWARPVVGLMRQSRIITYIVNCFAEPWSHEMAYQMGSREKGDFTGKILMSIGIPICYTLGIMLMKGVLEECCIGMVLLGLSIIMVILKKYQIILQRRKA